jgi:outer membrane immunogenic protein
MTFALTSKNVTLGLAGLFLLTSLSAGRAADMPVKAPVYRAAPAYSWTGFYVGGQAGAGWFSNQVTNGPNPADGTVNFPPGFVHNKINGSGALGGGYAGYNYQIEKFVIGIDGDYSWANLTGSTTDIGPTGFTNNSTDRLKWIATLSGRLGYAIDNWLLFGKAGWAWGGIRGNSSTFNAVGVNTNNNSNSDTRNGWLIGAGVEWGFAAHWSAKLEYDYVKFRNSNYNNTDVTVAGVVTTPGRSATSDLSMIKLGAAYRF